jgi:methionyl-tRNA formyltransferase
MRVLFLGNNWVGWQVVRWLRQQQEEIAGIVLHPNHKRSYGEEIIRSAGVDATRIFDGSRLREPEVLNALRGLEPEIAVSALFGYILRDEFLSLPPAGCVNLHPAFLPYNRGAFPNVWSIIDGTPAGATLHYIDAGVDTGDIIARRQVRVEPIDTGESLYRRLERACVELFIENWPLLRAGKAPRESQLGERGTCHRVRDAAQIDEIDPEASYTAKELIDLIRARTFPPHPGAYFRCAGRKVYLRLQLSYEEEESRRFDAAHD